MAAWEPYDVMSATLVVPDYNYTLQIKPQGEITEEGFKNQTIHMADSNAEEVISLATGSIFYVSWDWNVLTESNIGTILDLYHDAAKANGMARSFLWTGHDGHTYTVRFRCKASRRGRVLYAYGMPGVRLRLLGRGA